MKKSIILLAISLCLFSLGLFAQNNLNTNLDKASLPFRSIQLLPNTPPAISQNAASYIAIDDSMYYWNWDSVAQNWKNQAFQKIINFVYDAHHNLTSRTLQNWSGSSWVNGSLSTYTYDANNNLTNVFYQVWSGSSWTNNFQFIYIFNANNKQTSYLYQTWSGSSWTNASLHTYTYDAHNNQTTSLYQNWSGSSWTNTDLDTYTYDVNNNQTSDITQIWSGSAWKNSSLSTLTYNANNKETSDTNYTWSGSSWTNSFLNTFTYDVNNNQTSDLYQSWSGSAWKNSFLYAYTYDVNNNQTSELEQSWSGSAWINIHLYAYTYNADNLFNSYTFKIYNHTGTKVISGDSIYYYLTPVLVLGVNNTLFQPGNMLIYPNPTRGNAVITAKNTFIKTVEIYNMLGEKVQTQDAASASNRSTMQINLSNQAAGAYIYKVLSDNGTLIGQGKLIIQK